MAMGAERGGRKLQALQLTCEISHGFRPGKPTNDDLKLQPWHFARSVKSVRTRRSNNVRRRVHLRIHPLATLAHPRAPGGP